MDWNENLTKNGAANSITKEENEEIQRGDKISFKVVDEIVDTLNDNQEYKIPGKKYIHVKKILFSKIYERIEREYEYPEEYGQYKKHDGRGFVPDGGVILLINEEESVRNFSVWDPVFACEMKKQGKKENKDNNTCGNAIERGAKNIMAFEDACIGESIFPYIGFCFGYDFHKEYMHGKMAPMNHGGGYNVENLHNGKNGTQRATFYTKDEPYNRDEIHTKSMNMIEQVVQYYKNKYSLNTN